MTSNPRRLYVLWISVSLMVFMRVTHGYNDNDNDNGLAVSSGQLSDNHVSTSGYDVTSAIRVVTIQCEPFVSIRWSPGLIGNDRYHGYYINLLQRILPGYRINLRLSNDGQIGREQPEGAWSGMLGEVATKEADVALGPMVHPISSGHLTSIPFHRIHLAGVVASADHSGITTLLQLVENDTISMRVGVVRSSDVEVILKQATLEEDPVLYRLWESISAEYDASTVGSLNEGIDRVRREQFVLLTVKEQALYHTQQEPCDITMVSGLTTRFYHGVVVRNDSTTLVEVLTQGIRSSMALDSTWDGVPGCSEMMEQSTMQPETNLHGPSNPRFQQLPISPVAKMADSRRPDHENSVTSKHITVATFLKPPYMMQLPNSTLTGYLVDLLKEISVIVPFQYNLNLVPARQAYGKRRHGRWTGLIGELLDSDVDLAAAPFIQTHRHSRFIDYTKPYLHSTLSILVRMPVDGVGGDDITEAENLITDDNHMGLPFFFLEDLVNHTRQFGVVRGSWTEKRLKTSSETLHRDIWSIIRTGNRGHVVSSLQEALRMVREEDFALLVESTDGAYLSSQLPCDLLLLDQFTAVTHYMFAVKKGSSFVRDVDLALIELQERGLLQQLYHKWWDDDQCWSERDDERIVDGGVLHQEINIAGEDDFGPSSAGEMEEAAHEDSTSEPHTLMFTASDSTYPQSETQSVSEGRDLSSIISSRITTTEPNIRNQITTNIFEVETLQKQYKNMSEAIQNSDPTGDVDVTGASVDATTETLHASHSQPREMSYWTESVNSFITPNSSSPTHTIKTVTVNETAFPNKTHLIVSQNNLTAHHTIDNKNNDMFVHSKDINSSSNTLLGYQLQRNYSEFTIPPRYNAGTENYTHSNDTRDEDSDRIINFKLHDSDGVTRSISPTITIQTVATNSTNGPGDDVMNSSTICHESSKFYTICVSYFMYTFVLR